MKIISAADQQGDPDRADGLITTLRVATDTLHWNLLDACFGMGRVRLSAGGNRAWLPTDGRSDADQVGARGRIVSTAEDARGLHPGQARQLNLDTIISKRPDMTW
jgi:hypothetical protein